MLDELVENMIFFMFIKFLAAKDSRSTTGIEKRPAPHTKL